MKWFISEDTIRLTSDELHGNIRYIRENARCEFTNIMRAHNFTEPHVTSFKKVDRKYIAAHFGAEVVKKMEALYEDHKRK